MTAVLDMVNKTDASILNAVQMIQARDTVITGLKEQVANLTAQLANAVTDVPADLVTKVNADADALNAVATPPTP